MKSNYKPDKSNSKLCNECQNFNLIGKDFCSIPFHENRMHQLGFISEVSLKINCSSCQFISKSFCAGPVSFTKNEESRIQGSRYKIVHRSTDACLNIWLCPCLDNDNVRLDIRFLARDNDLVIRAERLIYSSWIDVNLVLKRIALLRDYGDPHH